MPVEFPADLINKISIFFQVILALSGAFFLAFWLSMVIWTFRDIRSRTRDILAQILATLMVLLFNIPGLFLYFILRPKETLAEAYERALEEEALLQGIEEREVCPGCGRKVEPDFLVCPYCHTRLKKACPECGRLLHLSWNICPYCAATFAAPAPSEASALTDEEEEPEVAPVEIPEGEEAED